MSCSASARSASKVRDGLLWSNRTPFIPAQAGIQNWFEALCNFALGPRFRGDERMSRTRYGLEQ